MILWLTITFIVSSYAYSGTSATFDGTQKQVSLSPSQYRSTHNQMYWASSSSWYAVGLGATSCVDGVLTARPRTMADYAEWVATLTQEDGSLTRADVGTFTNEDDRLTDTIMKRLRTADGLDLQWIEKEYGKNIKEQTIKGAQLGLDLGMATIRRTNDAENLRLTDPDGFLYSNYIISSIFSQLGYE